MPEKPDNWIRLRDKTLDWSVFRIRDQVMKRIRHFFSERGFLEIEAPLLTPFPTLDNNIESIGCCIHYPDASERMHYLHTSPEHAMKKLLAGGSGNIFYLGKVFRNRELTNLHNPEFTMLEWYQVHAGYQDLMDLSREFIQDLAETVFRCSRIRYQTHCIDLNAPWEKKTLAGLFMDVYGLEDDRFLCIDSLRETAVKHGVYHTPEDDWETLFHRLFMEKIEPGLGSQAPVFVMDYPVQMGLMARRKPENEAYVERTELYMTGLEIANGYTELIQTPELTGRFMNQQTLIIKTRGETLLIDNELLDALQSGIPPCAGMAMGIDRLIMLFLDKSDIRDVLLFPHSSD
ncbi:EF-P lysine aminoacylase GenX [bacterium]|nr:EF-P lysine aminoacylase GenX [bacterium]